MLETHDTFTLVLEPLEEPIAPCLPGQFNMLYVFGLGEVPISISGLDASTDGLVHTIRRLGSVTQGMERLKPGDVIGVRGPFGSKWPLPKEKEDLLLIAGGLGIAPLRPVLLDVALRIQEFKRVTLLYGARTPADRLYVREMESWQEGGMEIVVSVDLPDVSWQGNVGVITAFIHKFLRDPQHTRIFLCGPEIMMQFALLEIMRFPVSEEAVFISMERNMKCATGFCGHCQYGPYFLCKEGPIFSYRQVKPWLNIKEL